MGVVRGERESLWVVGSSASCTLSCGVAHVRLRTWLSCQFADRKQQHRGRKRAPLQPMPGKGDVHKVYAMDDTPSEEGLPVLALGCEPEPCVSPVEYVEKKAVYFIPPGVRATSIGVDFYKKQLTQQLKGIKEAPESQERPESASSSGIISGRSDAHWGSEVGDMYPVSVKVVKVLVPGKDGAQMGTSKALERGESCFVNSYASPWDYVD